MTSGPRLKTKPEDFLVRENLLAPLADPAAATHRYLLLRKTGYTTFEAIRLLADRLGCATVDITYAGLKDEDGVTEQLIAVPVHASEILAGHGFAGIRESTDRRQISIHHYGYGMAPLRVGRLDGNSFRIVVRNLDPEVAGQIGATRKISFCALNYYDTQRFGVPTGPKLTHILGACLLKGDWQGAFDTLLMLGAPESPLAERWEGRPEAFFEERLDPRVVSFYLSAYASHEWNRALEAVVADAGPDRSYIETVDGIDYRYLWTSQAAADILAKRPDLPYRRLTLDREIAETSSSRATVVQVPLLLEAAEPDDMHPGKSSAVLRFALPSGCYATCVVRQLLIPLRGARQPAPSP